MKLLSFKSDLLTVSLSTEEIQDIAKLLTLASEQQYLSGDAGVLPNQLAELRLNFDNIQNSLEISPLSWKHIYDLLWSIGAQGISTLDIDRDRLNELSDALNDILTSASNLSRK